MKRLNQFLQNRNGRWYYIRRVPENVADLDCRGMIRTSLRTDSLELARKRRNSMIEADNAYWATLIESRSTKTDQTQDNITTSRYRASKERAMARGYIYTPVNQLAQTADLTDILARLVDALKVPTRDQKEEVEALLGGTIPKSLKISDAFDLYCKEIAIGDLHGKSAKQKKDWEKIKRRAVNNFIALCGDLEMDKISRKHGRDFYNWWGKRLHPTDGSKPLHPNSANRDIGNLRKLFREYWVYEGDEKRENPFNNLRYSDNVYKEIPVFSNDWIRSRVLKKDALSSLNKEAALLVYTLIETGCRPSEIANIQPQHIHLDSKTPYIEIKPTENRQLKSRSAIREVPLVGVSLQAMTMAPNGFPRYRDKGNSLSVLLLKTFRKNGLFPTEDHRIYSFRHSFEKRMLEAGLDYGLRCILMGHSNSRPSYGDGGSMEYRRNELLKIAHPIADDFVESLFEQLNIS